MARRSAASSSGRSAPATMICAEATLRGSAIEAGAVSRLRQQSLEKRHAAIDADVMRRAATAPDQRPQFAALVTRARSVFTAPPSTART